MTHRIIDRMSPGRLAWLTILADGKPHKAKAHIGRTGYDCRVLGWVEWWCSKDDAGAPYSTIIARYAGRKPTPSMAMHDDGWRYGSTEVITPLGLQKLREATAMPRAAPPDGGG